MKIEVYPLFLKIEKYATLRKGHGTVLTRFTQITDTISAVIL